MIPVVLGLLIPVTGLPAQEAVPAESDSLPACRDAISESERLQIYSPNDPGLVVDLRSDTHDWRFERGRLLVTGADCDGCMPRVFEPPLELRYRVGTYKDHGAVYGTGLGILWTVYVLRDSGSDSSDSIGASGWIPLVLGGLSALAGAVVGSLIGSFFPRWERCALEPVGE